MCALLWSCSLHFVVLCTMTISLLFYSILSPAIPSPHPGLPNHRADLRGLLYLLVSCAAALLTCPAGSAVVQAALPSNPASIPSVHLRFPFSCDSVSPPLT